MAIGISQVPSVHEAQALHRVHIGLAAVGSMAWIVSLRTMQAEVASLIRFIFP